MEANLEHTEEAITMKEWYSRFKRHVKSLGIKLIPTSITHPQTNGGEDREVLRLLQQVQREVILRA